jgi:hypothetical protein
MSRTTQRRPRARRTRRPILGLAPAPPLRIRAARVEDAQARIASGHYDRPDVRAHLVDELLKAITEN